MNPEQIFDWLDANCRGDIIDYIQKLKDESDSMIATLEQENRQMRARMERLEKEAKND